MSNNVKSSEKIKLAEKDNILKARGIEVAMKITDFFSNAVINPKIPITENGDPLLKISWIILLWKLLW